MACPVIVVENEIADELIGYLKKFVAEMKLGPAYDQNTKIYFLFNTQPKTVNLRK